MPSGNRRSEKYDQKAHGCHHEAEPEPRARLSLSGNESAQKERRRENDQDPAKNAHGLSPTLQQVFWRKIDKSSGELGCWPWQGARTGNDYGYIRLNGIRFAAHRLAYALTNGAIPKDLFVCHRCDNPRCCNPAHLFLGSASDNTRDSVAKGRWHMPAKKRVGSKHGRAKIDERQAIEIRRAYTTGSVSQEQLASRYHISERSIYGIIARKTWKHV